jgi:hypothetical protein
MSSTRAWSLTYYPTETGFNATTVTGTPANGSWFGVDGCNQLVILGTYTRAAGTNLAFRLESTIDNGTTVNIVQSEEVSFGTGTFDTLTHNDDDGASKKFQLNYPIAGMVGMNMRLGGVTCTSGSTDALTITAIVGCMP